MGRGNVILSKIGKEKKKGSWGLESRKQWHCTSPHPGPTQTEETGGPEAEGPGPWNTCWDPGHTQCWCRAGLLMVARGKPVRPPHLFGEACYRGHRDLPRGPAGAGEDPEPSLYGRFHFWESSVVRGWQSWNDCWIPGPFPPNPMSSMTWLTAPPSVRGLFPCRLLRVSWTARR